MKLPKVTRKMAFATAAGACLIGTTGCTDATRAKWGNTLGDTYAQVICYSGEREIYNGFSTGKVRSEQNSDGYYFTEQQTGVLKEVSGNCDITYFESDEGPSPTKRPAPPRRR